VALQTWLIIPDCHHPYVNKKAWKLVLKVAKDLKPYGLVSLGDFADNYMISRYTKDPHRLTYDQELVAVETARKQLDKLGAKRKIITLGNHEDRYEEYIKKNTPELTSRRSFDDETGFSEAGWEVVPYLRATKIGKLNITHTTGRSGKHVATATLQDYQHNVMVGHAHRAQLIAEGNAVGETHVSVCNGWLGDANQIDYTHRVKAYRDWTLAFSLVGLDTRTQNIYIDLKLIVVDKGKYSCWVKGKLYSV